MNKRHEEIEREEFLRVKRRFPQARLKADYNREIIDIGVEIPTQEGVWILLKGEQTNDCYELISPGFAWFERLETLDDVARTLYSCRESS
ncbi:hypothetical protein BEP19_04570 [Ammoniphilus oxalaticus]|uniref:Uncharacterized protein n=1 Tax=Ammoniphilus oxalaticus TaxID=66863 RepID=A0A419SM08_9BACL|nr:hypothetical protein [Ammoniphilus oxalaticus]RKD25098.1 hypothetical protein BEP19_04570 [Ammoniphilus oxalaticus]